MQRNVLQAQPHPLAGEEPRELLRAAPGARGDGDGPVLLLAATEVLRGQVRQGVAVAGCGARPERRRWTVSGTTPVRGAARSGVVPVVLIASRTGTLAPTWASSAATAST